MKKINDNTVTTATEVANTNASENTAKGNRKNASNQKRQAIPAMWRILGRAQKAFEAQLEKDNRVKLKCIESYLVAEMNDVPRFWNEFMEQVEKLLDSRKYVRECQQLEYDPTNVAEHIVFLGSSTLNKVLKYGVQSVLGSKLMFYGDRFSPEFAEKYRAKISAFLKDE